MLEKVAPLPCANGKPFPAEPACLRWKSLSIISNREPSSSEKAAYIGRTATNHGETCGNGKPGRSPGRRSRPLRRRRRTKPQVLSGSAVPPQEEFHPIASRLSAAYNLQTFRHGKLILRGNASRRYKVHPRP